MVRTCRDSSDRRRGRPLAELDSQPPRLSSERAEPAPADAYQSRPCRPTEKNVVVVDPIVLDCTPSGFGSGTAAEVRAARIAAAMLAAEHHGHVRWHRCAVIERDHHLRPGATVLARMTVPDEAKRSTSTSSPSASTDATSVNGAEMEYPQVLRWRNVSVSPR